MLGQAETVSMRKLLTKMFGSIDGVAESLEESVAKLAGVGA